MANRQQVMPITNEVSSELRLVTIARLLVLFNAQPITYFDTVIYYFELVHSTSQGRLDPMHIGCAFSSSVDRSLHNYLRSNFCLGQAYISVISMVQGKGYDESRGKTLAALYTPQMHLYKCTMTVLLHGH